MAQVALAWVLKNPVVDSVLSGATKAHHLADAVAALDIDLSEDEVTALEAGYVPRAPTYLHLVRARTPPAIGVVSADARVNA
ncbi:aldo/keto reductase [Microbacterium sp.]|uniref:aldo/keto reductase n=1 Tax=Microbacterium sp. TaxID=51671 RepID=UPI003221CA55